MPRKAREVPWLEQRDNGIWYACWYDKQQRRTGRLSLDTKEAGEAQARFALFLTEGRELRSPVAKDAGLSVATALNDYEREHVNSDQGPVAKQRQYIALAHLRAWFKTTAVEALDTLMSRAYRAHRAGQGVADATIRRELNTLVAAVNHATKWKRLKGFDTSCIELPEVAEEEARWLTHDEMRRLREAAGEDTRVRRFIENAYYSAGRRAAVVALTVFQVNWDGGYVNLGKPGERKTKKRKAIVPIDPQWAPWLRRQYDEACARMAEQSTDPGYLLGHGGASWKSFAAACKRAKLVNVTPHTLRHSRATHLLLDGADIWFVAKLLGDTVQMVERVYAHACQAAMGKRLERDKTGA